MTFGQPTEQTSFLADEVTVRLANSAGFSSTLGATIGAVNLTGRAVKTAPHADNISVAAVLPVCRQTDAGNTSMTRRTYACITIEQKIPKLLEALLTFGLWF